MIVPGATVPAGLVALIGVTAIGYAEGEENSDEFQQYLAEFEPDYLTTYTVVPHADSQEFVDFRTTVCGQTKGTVEGAKGYIWYTPRSRSRRSRRTATTTPSPNIAG
jgi:hypothetical protein